MVVCIVLIIMCMRDVDATRKDMDKSFSDLTTNIDDKVKYLRNKQVSDNATMISKLQKENRDLVQQVRKINLINNQTIRCSNEYMTADTSESSTNNQNFITYLSDDKNNVKTTAKNNKISQKEKSTGSKTSSVYLSKTSTNEHKKTKSKYTDSVENMLSTLPENVIEWTVKKGNNTIESKSDPDDEIEQDGDESEVTCDKKSTTSNKSINVELDVNDEDNSKNNSHEESKNDDDDSEDEDSEDDEDDDSEDDEGDDSEGDEDDDEDDSEEEDNESKLNNSDESEDLNNTKSNDTNSIVEGTVGNTDKNSVNIEVEFVGNKKIPKTTDKELQQMTDITLLSKKIETELSSESDESDGESFSKLKAQLDNDDKQTKKKSNTEFKKLMESITIGSDSHKNKKNKKSKNVKSLLNDNNSNSSNDSGNDSGILSESDGTFTSNGSLKNINDYTAKELRELAKKYLIPVSIQSNAGGRRFLKKSELYDKLTSCIKK